MAESGTGSKGIGKVFQKSIIRTREKVLRNLGKADRTRDDELEQHVLNFNDQQATAAKLQKDLKHYQVCVKGTGQKICYNAMYGLYASEMSLASQNMYRSIKETYDPTWVGYTETVSSIELLTNLWEDYITKLSDQLQTPLTDYNSRFPEVKTKIAKRGRKLTDYDSMRHNYEASQAKKQDEPKVAKALEDLNEAKHIYETINSELHEDLPSLYQSRVGFLATYFHSLFDTEAVFHRESSKLKDKMADITGRLCEEAERSNGGQMFRMKSINKNGARGSMDGADSGQFSSTNDNLSTSMRQTSGQFVRMESNTSASSPQTEFAPTSRPTPAMRPTASVVGGVNGRGDRTSGGGLTPKINNTEVQLNNEAEMMASQQRMQGLAISPSLQMNSPTYQDDSPSLNSNSRGAQVKSPSLHLNSPGVQMNSPSLNTNSMSLQRDDDEDSDDDDPNSSTMEDQRRMSAMAVDPTQNVYSLAKNVDETTPGLEESIDFTRNNVTSSIPSHRILFQVIATHRYVGDDVDELSFEPGEVITVVPFDDPDEQDDGWLTGIKESTRDKGVFPENFTKRI